MRWLRKGAEPLELPARRRLSPEHGGTYLALEKQPVIAALMRDQGHLCGFCMKRVDLYERDARGSLVMDEPSQPRWKKEPGRAEWPWKIAHREPQSVAPERALDWNNLVGACRGNDLAGTDSRTCDSRQGNRRLTVDPYNRASVAKVLGRSAPPSPRPAPGTSPCKGYELYSEDPAVEQDLQEHLGLNDGYLPDNRKTVLDQFVIFLRAKLPAVEQLPPDEKRERVRVLYDEWKWEDRRGNRLRPFCGVVEVRYKLAR